MKPHGHKFLNDVKVGKIAEQKVIDLLEEYGCEVTDLRSNHDGCDLSASYKGWPFTVEVKNDVRSLTSGNLYLELKAVQNCTAEFMCLVSGEDFHFFPTSRIKYLTSLDQFDNFKTNQELVGSNTEYYGKLMPISEAFSLSLPVILSTHVYGGDIENICKKKTVKKVKHSTDDDILF